MHLTSSGPIIPITFQRCSCFWVVSIWLRHGNITPNWCHLPRGYYHCPHPPCYQEPQMGNSLDQMGLPVQKNTAKKKLSNQVTIKIDPTQKKTILWIIRACLNEKFFTPIVKVIKWLHYINIINKDTAICSPVESNPKALKPLLASCVPYLLGQHFEQSVAHTQPC